MTATSLLSSLLNHSPERHIYMAQLKEPSPSCPPQTNTATPSKIPNPLQDSKTSVAYMTVTHVNMVQAPANGAAMSSPENDADGIAPSALTTTAMTVGSELMVASILLLFVVLALAVVLYKYAAIRRRSRGDGQTTANGRLGTAVAGAGSEGIDLEVLQSLPITAYRAKDFEEAVDCAVCLAELADGEAARFLPMCGHGFHAECIDMWLHSRSTCPLCRLAVGKPDVSLPPPFALPPASPEPANYTTSLPATVLFWGSQGAVTATADGSSSPSSDTAVLVIEIPELAVLAPHDAVRSPGSARLRSLRRLWSRGRQGADTSSCSCSSAGAGADI